MFDTIHKSQLKLKFGQLNPVMDWCKKNCIGDWHVEDHDLNLYAYEQDTRDMYNEYTFEFIDERDFITFNLKFK